MRVSVFLSIFLSIYGLLHAYTFFKVKNAFRLSRRSGVGLFVFLAFMVLCPMLTRLSERVSSELLSVSLAYVGYTWMGVLFLFICLHLCLDIAGFLWRLFNRGKPVWNRMLSRRVAFWFCAAASVVLASFGYFEALRIRTDHVVIRSQKMPAAISKIRIVQISDVHLGLMVRESLLRSILRKAAAEKPDILVSTGDLVDGQIDDISGMAGLFRSIDAPYGKFAVTGNHEYYAGIERAMAFTEQAGFTLLWGDERDVLGIMRVVGVEDPTADRFPGIPTRSEDQVLSSEADSRFVLLLKHRPVLNPKSIGRFDLQLSGHAHKGQIFPFSLIIRALYPIDAGLLSLPRDGFLYVSRGSGTWGPPMRILSPPEVTVIDLIPK